MKVYIFIALVLSAVAAADIKEEWESFKVKYNKTYKTPEDEEYRFGIFTKSYETIESHNADHARGLKTYTMAINKFADMLPSELASGVSMDYYRESLKRNATTFLRPFNIQAPNSIDWRTYGAVSGVKNQGDCGSCWAFATTGVIESQWYLATGQLPSLSEQFLVDCSYYDAGCNGGFMTNAYEFILSVGGIPSEQAYPYYGYDGQCRMNGLYAAAQIRNYVNIQSKNEQALKEAVATVGPIATVVDVEQGFQYYSSGVLYDYYCSSDSFNHGVLIVGYGTDAYYGDYWLVKNSWGYDWGESGYLRIARNQNSHCAIATAASYVIV